MANNTTLDPGTGGDTIATDDVAGVKYERVKLTDGTEDSTTAIAAGGGVEAGALRVTVASDSTGVLSVDDNGATLSVDDGGGSLTVDGSVTADTELTTADLDTGAGTDTRAVVGVALAASGGAVLAGAANPIPVSDNGGSLTVDGTVEIGATSLAALESITVVDGGASLTVDNAGTFVTQENGALLTAAQLIDDSIVADDAAFTVATTKVNMAGFLADQASTDSVNEGDAGAARMTLDRKQIVTLAPSADTEGLTISTLVSAATTNATSVKASAGKLYGWYIYNDGAAEVYFKLYNKASSPTVGTDVPVMTLGIPAGGGANQEFTNGITFATGIAFAVTTGATTADTGAVALSQVVSNLLYQ